MLDSSSKCRPTFHKVMVSKCLIALAALFIVLPVNSGEQKYKFGPIPHKKEVECLAQAIYHEARGEPEKGKFAVAHVVVNRAKSMRFPSTICKVVYQPGQFSWTSDKSLRPRVDSTALAIAKLVLAGFSPIPEFAATHFHNRTVKPGWKLKKLAIIGNHVFYKHHE